MSMAEPGACKRSIEETSCAFSRKCRQAVATVGVFLWICGTSAGGQVTGIQVRSAEPATQSAVVASNPANAARPAVPIILDTDIGTDVDDAGALAVLHALANRGEARVLAVMSSNRNRWSAPAIDVINTYYGRPETPIGASRVGPDDEVWYHDDVPRFARRLQTSGDAPEAVALYRRTLADQPDRSVTIVVVGWLTNMADLLNSGPDDASRLPGGELVARKVRELVAMGGVWPNTQGQGEYNFTMDRKAAAEVIRNWPGKIVFTGLGVDVMTGGRFVAHASPSNPVRVFYGNFFRANKVSDRPSWDQIAVLYAVRGLSEYFTVGSEGQCTVRGDQEFEWVPGPSAKAHAYLAYRMPQAQLAREIEDLMLARPATRPHGD